MTFQEKEVEADGFKIRYREAGQGRPVVMLDATGWRGTILHDALAEKYHVFSLELPGMGDSSANIESKSIEDLAATSAKAAAALTTERYTLIGTSFGANVAIWQAVQSPDQVEALILVSPTAIQPQDAPAGASAEDHQSHQNRVVLDETPHPESQDQHIQFCRIF